MDSTVQSMESVGDLAMSRAMPLRLGSGATDAQMTKTSKEFESMFMSQMLQPMFEGIKVDPIFGGGHGEEVMRGLLVQEYGKMISKSGKIGIAAAVKSEMIKSQANAASSKTSGMATASHAAITTKVGPSSFASSVPTIMTQPTTSTMSQTSSLGGNYDSLQ